MLTTAVSDFAQVKHPSLQDEQMHLGKQGLIHLPIAFLSKTI